MCLFIFNHISFVFFSKIFPELRLAMDTIDKEQIAKAFEHFLATGNLSSKTNLGLRQVNFPIDFMIKMIFYLDKWFFDHC